MGGAIMIRKDASAVLYLRRFFWIFFISLSMVYSGPAQSLGTSWLIGTKIPHSIFSPIDSQPRILSPQATFTNSTTINIPASPSIVPAISNPYPSTITVSGLTGTIAAMTVKLNGFHHTQQKDVDALLVGPGGQKFIFMSDLGGANASPPTIDLTFDDAAGGLAPATVINATGTYLPTNYTSGDTFLAPAPSGPYNEAAPAASATFASIFNGIDPNGNWSLYIMDDAGADEGACNGGWTLNITPSAGAAGTTTTVMSSLNPSLTTNSVTLSAHVVKTSDSSNVTVGTVTFVDNSTGTTLASNVALNGSGNASTPALSGLAERRHLVTATYSGDPSFLTSAGTIFQTVDFPTSSPGVGNYCNTNSVTIPDGAGTSGPAVQFPSHITVTGFPPFPVGSLRVTLGNVTHTAAQDLDILLVAPSGQNLIIVSDSGGNTTNVTLLVDDSAPTQIAAGGAWGTTGTTVSTKPVDRTAGDTFPSPAPAGPYNSPSPVGVATLASAFTGATANGVWSLYIIDDAGGDIGTMSGGWCLNIAVPSAANVPISGRVLSATGQPVSMARVTLSDASGNPRVAITNPFGYYRFDDVASGLTYIIGVSSKQYQFSPRVITVNDAVNDLDIMADQ